MTTTERATLEAEPRGIVTESELAWYRLQGLKYTLGGSIVRLLEVCKYEVKEHEIQREEVEEVIDAVIAEVGVSEDRATPDLLEGMRLLEAAGHDFATALCKVAEALEQVYWNHELRGGRDAEAE